MLTEFLERVELEESQELSSSQYSLGQVRSCAPKVAFKGAFHTTMKVIIKNYNNVIILAGIAIAI